MVFCLGLALAAGLTAQVNDDALKLPEQTVAPGEASLTLSVDLPPEYHLTAEAPYQATFTSGDKQIVAFGRQAAQTLVQPQLPINIPVKVNPGRTLLKVELLLYYCKSGAEGLCLFKEARLVLPVKVVKGAGKNKLSVIYKVKTP
jgi:hypothetical protein